MNLEAVSGHSLSSSFFQIFIGNEIALRNLIFSIVLSYTLSLMISAYGDQSVQFWETEGSHILYISPATKKGVCVCVCD